MQILLNGTDLFTQVSANASIQRRQGFIKQQDARLGYQSARQRHALLLSAGQLMRILLFVSCQFHQSDGVLDALFDHIRRHLRHLEAERDVFQGRHVGEQRIALKHHPDVALLSLRVRDVFAIHADRAGVGHFKARETPQECRLTAARGAQKGNEFPAFNIEIQVFKHPRRTKMLRERTE